MIEFELGCLWLTWCGLALAWVHGYGESQSWWSVACFACGFVGVQLVISLAANGTTATAVIGGGLLVACCVLLVVAVLSVCDERSP